MKPIIFTDEDIIKILAGKKRQVERRIKQEHVTNALIRGVIIGTPAFNLDVCPYGKPGEKLWVREAWRYSAWGEDWAWIEYRDGQEKLIDVELAQEYDWYPGKRINFDGIMQKCSDEMLAKGVEPINGMFKNEDIELNWKPSICMPRWASRITLEITKVRVKHSNSKGCFMWIIDFRVVDINYGKKQN